MADMKIASTAALGRVAATAGELALPQAAAAGPAAIGIVAGALLAEGVHRWMWPEDLPGDPARDESSSASAGRNVEPLRAESREADMRGRPVGSPRPGRSRGSEAAEVFVAVPAASAVPPLPNPGPAGPWATALPAVTPSSAPYVRPGSSAAGRIDAMPGQPIDRASPLVGAMPGRAPVAAGPTILAMTSPSPGSAPGNGAATPDERRALINEVDTLLRQVELARHDPSLGPGQHPGDSTLHPDVEQLMQAGRDLAQAVTILHAELRGRGVDPGESVDGGAVRLDRIPSGPALADAITRLGSGTGLPVGPYDRTDSILKPEQLAVVSAGLRAVDSVQREHAQGVVTEARQTHARHEDRKHRSLAQGGAGSEDELGLDRTTEARERLDEVLLAYRRAVPEIEGIADLQRLTERQAEVLGALRALDPSR